MKNYLNKRKFDYLILETGDVYVGLGYGAKNNSIGELVFNTSITGYQEVITDPSYKGQIVVFTYPHIGNVGTCTRNQESERIWLKGIITRELPTKASNWRSEKNFNRYLIDNNLAGLAEIDTRKLTRVLRNEGNLLGMIVRDKIEYKEALVRIKEYKCYKQENESLFFNCREHRKIKTSKKRKIPCMLHIGILDLGCKANIINILEAFGCKVSVLNIIDPICIEQLKIDAVLVSNGPGNPESYINAVTIIKKIIAKKIPLLGICLGHQLLGIAFGAKIEKLLFGHHGINHPVKDLCTRKVFITSQNHNYVLSREFFPPVLSITHVSLFDNSIQGFTHNEQVFMGFQGHPEGSPGPLDISENIIKKFLVKTLEKKRLTLLEETQDESFDNRLRADRSRTSMRI